VIGSNEYIQRDPVAALPVLYLSTHTSSTHATSEFCILNSDFGIWLLPTAYCLLKLGVSIVCDLEPMLYLIIDVG
jgi:hypothetical protein